MAARDEALRLVFRCPLRLERTDDVRSRGDQKDAGLDRDPAGPGAPTQPMAVSLAMGWRGNVEGLGSATVNEPQP